MSDRSTGPATVPPAVTGLLPSILTRPSAKARIVSVMRGSSRMAPSSLILLNSGSSCPSAALISSSVDVRSFPSMPSQRAS